MQSLERRLGLFSVTTISISSMLASGLFVVPGIGFETTGSSLFLAYIVAAIAILPAAMSKAELATAMPTSGGTYVFIERSFGPLIGTVSGLGLYLSILLKVAFALVGLGAYFVIFPSVPVAPVIALSIVAIALLNIVGVGKVSSLLTFILVVTLLGIALLFGLSVGPAAIDNIEPLFAQGTDAFISATAIVFISYAGILKVAAIAEEVKNPEKVIPQGILLSLGIAALLYSSVAFVMSAVFPMEDIAGSMSPIHTWAGEVGGTIVGVIIGIIALLAIINSCNAGVLAASRFPFAMSRDNLLPKPLGRLSKKFLTPVMSIVLSSLLVGASIVFLDVSKIAKLASAFMILIYMLENLCVIILRETRPQWYSPRYKAPFYPVLQIFGIGSGALFLYAMGSLSLVAILAISIPGTIFYLLYAKKRTTRKGVVGIKGKRPDIAEQAVTADVIGRTCRHYYTPEAESEVVVALFGKERSADMLIEMGLSLTAKGGVEIVSLIEVPEQATVQDIQEEPMEIRSIRRRALAMDAGEHSINFDSIVTHDLSQSIFEVSQSAHCEWLLIEWKGKKRGRLTMGDQMSWLKSHLHCHLAIYKDAGIRYIRKIMVNLNDDRNDNIILERVEHLAKVFNARLLFVTYAKADASEEDQELMRQQLLERVAHLSEDLSVEVLQGESEQEAIVARSVGVDLFVLGSQDHSFIGNFRPSRDNFLIAKSACSVLALHNSSFKNV